MRENAIACNGSYTSNFVLSVNLSLSRKNLTSFVSINHHQNVLESINGPGVPVFNNLIIVVPARDFRNQLNVSQ